MNSSTTRAFASLIHHPTAAHPSAGTLALVAVGAVTIVIATWRYGSHRYADGFCKGVQCRDRMCPAGHDTNPPAA